MNVNTVPVDRIALRQPQPPLATIATHSVELLHQRNALTNISAKLTLMQTASNMDQLILKLVVKDSKLYPLTTPLERTTKTTTACRSNTTIGKECLLALLMALGRLREQLRTVLPLAPFLTVQVQ
jgi:hypothetical protein